MPVPPSSDFELLAADDDRLLARPDDLTEARAQLRAARLEVVAGTGQVDAARDDILAFCRRHPDALHRSCLEGHLTGSAFVVDETRQLTLLLHHAKLDRWLQPGGHADGDGNLAGVAHREATEETGLAGLRLVVPAIDVDIHRIPPRSGEPGHLHLDLRFAVVAPAGAVVRNNHESLGFAWLGPDHPVVGASADLERAVRRSLAVVRQLGR